MREMKDSGIDWIGDIPNDWTLNKIKYVTTSRTVKYRLSEVGQYIGLENVESASGRYIKTGTEYEDGFFDGCETGDLLYGKLRPNLAKVMISPFKACCTGEFEVISASKIGKSFLQYCMLTEGFTQIVTASTYGAKMPRASWDFIKNIGIAYPDERQREKIISFLDAKCSEIDALTTDVQSEIDTLQAYKQSVITEAVTKGLDKNAPMKDSGIEWIGKIPKHWDVTPFRAYVKEHTEKNKSQKTTELLALSFALGVTLYKDKIYNKDRVKDNFEEYNVVHKGDLVLSPNDIIKGSIFVSKYYGCISPMYYIFSARNKDTHNLYYLSYLLRTKEAGRRFFFIARGLIGSILDNGKYVTRRMTVSRQDLLTFKVLLPPYEEQAKIVDYLDKKCVEIDSIISDKQELLSILSEYKKSIIYEYVTGKKEVPIK